MIIYRVQDRFGRGPFRPGFANNWVIERADHKNLIPWYEEFKIKSFPRNMHMGNGCLDIKTLRRWFSREEYMILYEFSYRAVEMNVDRILARSNTQCLFVRKKPLQNDIKIIALYDK